ncbi:MAG: aquaporin [Spirochaetales bacterium]|nr:aquaporin [Spirochaetales bacterium]
MKKIFVAELIGTFFLIFVSGSAAIMYGVGIKFDYLTTVLTFSAVLGVCYVLFRNISGAHFNPAVSFGYFMTARMSFGKFIIYFISQFLGGVLACLMLRVIFAAKFTNFLPKVYHEILRYDDLSSVAVIAIFEFIFAFLMMCTYLSLEHRKGVVSGIVMALSYFVMTSILYAVDGCGLNVIRILVPALFSWTWTNTIVYIIAVFVGCLAGSVCYGLLSENAAG